MSGVNAQQEARERLGGRPACVLEPSPPAVSEEPWLADDPLDGPADAVRPFGDGDQTWIARARDDPALAAWCAERWLGPWPRLTAVPPAWVSTRESLHRLAVYVVAAARRVANGKIGLRYTHRGFGTPFFADDRQVRIEDGDLVIVAEGRVTRRPITSLRDAGAFVDVALDDAPTADPAPDVPPQGDVDALLGIDPRAARTLGDWFGFSYSVLEELRATVDPADEPTRVQIWPEHFDAAFEFGSDTDGRRAGFGMSPGDAEHPEPYGYVLPWSGLPDDSDLWMTTPFLGARLSYSAIVAMDDQRAGVLAFFDDARRRIAGRTVSP